MTLEWILDFPVDSSLLSMMQTAADMALIAERIDIPCGASVRICGDEEIRALNASWRGLDRPTDVLSFPMVEYSEPEAFSEAEEQKADSFDPESGRLLLGDIVISADHVAAQADEYGHSKRREFAFLVAHSMLHLVGYDHMEPAEEERMFKKQEEILSAAVIPRT